MDLASGDRGGRYLHPDFQGPPSVISPAAPIFGYGSGSHIDLEDLFTDLLDGESAADLFSAFDDDTDTTTTAVAMDSIAPSQQLPLLAPRSTPPEPSKSTRATSQGRRKSTSDDEQDDDEYDDEEDEEDAPPKKRGRKTQEDKRMQRRERNREHAKRSRVRKKFLLESLQRSVDALRKENTQLKSAIRTNLTDQEAAALLARCDQATDSLTTNDSSAATKILEDPDFTLVKALQMAQQSFLITDPNLPDNPIVYASAGFMELTGFAVDQILGRNCRFLQGPETDPKSVDKIRRAIEEGRDGSVCLVNYREDGSTFYNQFFIAPLRGADGRIVNYVGVQCKVTEEYAKEVMRAEQEADMAIAQSRTKDAHMQPPTQAQAQAVA